MVKVEYIEEKPKHPPCVFVEDTLGHGMYHAPGDFQPMVHTERIESPKTTKNDEAAVFKPAAFKMKAPGDTKSVGPASLSPSTWSDTDVTEVYRRRKLESFLVSDPVAKTLEIGLLGQIEGPVSTLPQPQTIAEAITALVTLLREANMVAGSFELDDLFTLGFKRINTTLIKLHKHLGKLVGINSAPRDVPLEATMEPMSQTSQMTLQDIEVRPPPPAAFWNTRPTTVSPQVPLPPPAQDAADSSSQGSSTLSHVGRMPLGQAGAALLQARACDASP